MNRNERRTMRDLLKAAHANKEETPLSDHWRQGVMTDIRSTRLARKENGLAQLAPRFAIYGAALSAAGLIVGVWELPKLANEIRAAYVSQAFDLAASIWTLL